MTYIISSVQAGTSITTKDPLKDASWGNEFYGVTDCVVTSIEDPTSEQIAQQKADIDSANFAREQARVSAGAKLKTLGLTEEEVNALIGG